MAIYFHRGYTIIRNETVNNGMKWKTIEDQELYGKTIDDIKNRIDDIVGGYPTAKIPKRRWKDEGIIK